MQPQTTIRTLIAATLALLIISCNSAKKDKDAKDKPADTAAVITPTPSVDTPPTSPKTEVANQQKCFGNEGLKYETVITLNYSSASEVAGTVTSQEMGSNKKEIAKFTGTADGGKLNITFEGKKPIVGDASEWTNKPWTIDNKSGKEKLLIVFNAKNFETNKWADTDYEFDLVNCK
jgi:hypothetical protein